MIAALAAALLLIVGLCVVIVVLTSGRRVRGGMLDHSAAAARGELDNMSWDDPRTRINVDHRD